MHEISIIEINISVKPFQSTILPKMTNEMHMSFIKAIYPQMLWVLQFLCRVDMRLCGRKYDHFCRAWPGLNEVV